MYKSHVIAGRIIEIRNEHVLTQQGDAICSYHSRYYMLPDEETWTEMESIPLDISEPPRELLEPHHRFKGIGRYWNYAKPHLFPMKKSANRT